MPRAAVRFRQTEATRLFNAARKAGLTVRRVEVDLATGKMVLETGDEPPEPKSALAEWRTRRARAAG